MRIVVDSMNMAREVASISRVYKPEDVPKALDRLYGLRDYWRSHLGTLVPFWINRRIEDAEIYLIDLQTHGY